VSQMLAQPFQDDLFDEGLVREVPPPASVLVIEQHRPSALGYYVVLSREPFVKRCLLAADRDEALSLARKHKPDVAILDVDPFTGSTIVSLRELRPSMQFVLSTRCEQTSLAARQLGASAIVSVGATAPEIVDAVRHAATGGGGGAHHSSLEPSYDTEFDFNERERSVLALLVTGATNQEIALELHLSLDSIKKYATRIYRKLGVRNRVEALRRVDELARSGSQLIVA
jgi:DNA-binding NarL/FixJ family response regulator